MSAGMMLSWGVACGCITFVRTIKLTSRFSHAFPKPSGPLLLKVKLCLADRLPLHDMTGVVALDGIRVAELKVTSSRVDGV